MPLFFVNLSLCVPPCKLHVARGIMSPVLECDMDYAHLEPGMVAAGVRRGRTSSTIPFHDFLRLFHVCGDGWMRRERRYIYQRTWK
jgi:hypothetical protein